MPDFSIEKQFQGFVAGVDEAGRGPWAGPVAASAVIFRKPELTNEISLLGINDSKKISEKKREIIYQKLVSSDFLEYAVELAQPDEIDEYNILGATKRAMKRAVERLNTSISVVLIDGNQIIKDLNFQQKAVVKGDSISMSIAAASIIAKVTRDRLMRDLALEFPHYGWEKNKGYGTKDHIAAIEKYGICEHHRKSYAPIRKFLLT